MNAMPTLKKGHGTALNVVTFIPFSIGRLKNSPLLEGLKLRNFVRQSRAPARA